MKNIFAELTSRLDTAMVRINNLEDVSVDTTQTEMQREKWGKNRIPRSCETITKLIAY